MGDDSLLNEFFVDTQSHLDGVEVDALGLEKDSASKELIDDVFRRVHSIKGNAGMLGYTSVHECGQEFETFLDGVRDRGVATFEEIERIFNYLDNLKSVVDELRVEKGFGSELAPTAEEVVESADVVDVAGEPETADPAPAPGAPVGDIKPAPAPPPQGGAPQVAPVVKGGKKGSAKAAPDVEPVTYLTFELAGESYGIDIVKIREIISLEAITRVPNTKYYVEGVMNLRDQIIPVFNLKKKLDIAVDDDIGGIEKNIVIVEIGKVATGLKVDEVTGIKALYPSMIASPDSFYGAIPTNYLSGVGHAEEGAIIILNAEDLCDPSETLF